mmetsp:Transcript_1953/g.4466  ORF Transcript_1953/g.4466 Transcript_1953/m.4466 type:complete len:829 (-) Transcript_1953:212-2698(-)
MLLMDLESETILKQEVLPRGEEKRKGIDIVYLKEGHICIVDKPPDVFIEGDTEVTAIKLAQSQLRKLGHEHDYFHFINRLDYATSGLMVFGLSKLAAAAGTECFQNRRAQKVYVALVEGHVPKEWDQGIFVDIPLAQSPTDDFLQIEGKPEHPGRPCLSQIVAIDRGTIGPQNHKASKVLIWIRSGRRHQIRVHLASLGHPVAGDYTYGKGFPLATTIDRMCLHAWKLVMHLGNKTRGHHRHRKRARNAESVKFDTLAAESEDPFEQLKSATPPSYLKKEGAGNDDMPHSNNRIAWIPVQQEPGLASGKRITFPHAWRPRHLCKYRSAGLIFFRRRKSRRDEHAIGDQGQNRDDQEVRQDRTGNSNAGGDYEILLHRGRKGMNVKGRWMTGFRLVAPSHLPKVNKARLALDFDSAELASEIYKNNIAVRHLLSASLNRKPSMTSSANTTTRITKDEFLKIRFAQRLRRLGNGVGCVYAHPKPKRRRNKGSQEGGVTGTQDEKQVVTTGPKMDIDTPNEISVDGLSGDRSRGEIYEDHSNPSPAAGLKKEGNYEDNDAGDVFYLIYLPDDNEQREVLMKQLQEDEKIVDPVWAMTNSNVTTHTPKNQTSSRRYISVENRSPIEIDPTVADLLTSSDVNAFMGAIEKGAANGVALDSTPKQGLLWPLDENDPHILRIEQYFSTLPIEPSTRRKREKIAELPSGDCTSARGDRVLSIETKDRSNNRDEADRNPNGGAAGCENPRPEITNADSIGFDGNMQGDLFSNFHTGNSQVSARQQQQDHPGIDALLDGSNGNRVPMTNSPATSSQAPTIHNAAQAALTQNIPPRYHL